MHPDVCGSHTWNHPTLTALPMKKRPLPKLRLLTVAALLAMQPSFSGGSLQAQDSTESKIQLMADALSAREAGKYAEAQRLVAELLRIAPNDPSALRLKESIDDALQQSGGSGAAASTSMRSAPSASPRAMADQEAQRINASIAKAREAQALARKQMEGGESSNAVSTYDYALTMLEPNALTDSLINELKAERARAQRSADAPRRERSADRKEKAAPDAGASQAFLAERDLIEDLLLRGRGQFLAGDYSGAETTFKDVETRDPNNAEAKNFQRRIAEMRRSGGWIDREKTREQMLEEVSRSWQRPGVFQERPVPEEAPSGPAPLLEKLNRITIPSVNFTGVELARVVSTLSSISEEFDDTGMAP
jgi:general secretion pathway protein D